MPEKIAQRVRAARLQRGLLPFQVTSELDADSIERIESGDLEPTAAMIRIIARGLRCSPLWLTDGLDPHTIAGLRAEAAKAGGALTEGRFPEARDRYAALLRQPSLGMVPDLWRQAELGQAQAAEREGDLPQVITRVTRLLDSHLDESSESLARSSGHWTQFVDYRVRLATVLCRCHLEAGDISASVAVGESALDREIGAAGWTSSVIELGCALIATYGEQVDLHSHPEEAGHGSHLRLHLLLSELTSAAIELGEPRGRISVAWQNGIAAARSGLAPTARGLFEQALSLYGAGYHDPLGLARLRATMAGELIRADPATVEELFPVLTRAQTELAEAAAGIVDRGFCALALARADIVRGDPHQAIDRANEVVKAVGETAALLHVHASEVIAEAHLRLGETWEAEQALVAAAERWETMSSRERASAMWMRVADLRMRGDDPDGGRAALDRALAVMAV